MQTLTEHQAKALAFIVQHVRDRGFPPSVLEIAAHMGNSRNASFLTLKALAKKGAVDISPGIPRGIKVLQAPAT